MMNSIVSKSRNTCHCVLSRSIPYTNSSNFKLELVLILDLLALHP